MPDSERDALAGLTEDPQRRAALRWQWSALTQGLSALDIRRACTLGDGIAPLAQQQAALAAYASRTVSFVPASGAATRLFSSVRAAVNREEPCTIQSLLSRGEEVAATALSGRDHLAIFDDAPDGRDQRLALNYLLERWSNHPKGLLPFHRTAKGAHKTAADEHIREATELGIQQLVFTTPEGWQDRFPTCENLTIKTVVQDPSTHTIAIDEHGNLARTADGQVLFRPGGHGALLTKLEQLQADLVLIKNIDNITHERHAGRILPIRLRMMGMLLDWEQRLKDAHRALEHRAPGAEKAASKLAKEGFDLQLTTRVELLDFLDRPLRICAMVPDSGSPGGGPFWVHADGQTRCQIVEGVQIDRSIPGHAQSLRRATHFNPVDMALSLRRFDGEPYDLGRFVDPSSALIVHKVIVGHKVKGIEHPGLWNGSMAGWNTIFVEVPPWTFHPVKTIADLLKPGHQGKRDLIG